VGGGLAAARTPQSKTGLSGKHRRGTKECWGEQCESCTGRMCPVPPKRCIPEVSLHTRGLTKAWGHVTVTHMSSPQGTAVTSLPHPTGRGLGKVPPMGVGVGWGGGASAPQGHTQERDLT
jgi:hypothetical protein